MISARPSRYLWIAGLLGQTLLLATVSAQDNFGPAGQPAPGPQTQYLSNPYAPQPDEHPLMPALRWAYDGMDNLEKSRIIRPRWSNANGSTASSANTSTCSSKCDRTVQRLHVFPRPGDA